MATIKEVYDLIKEKQNKGEKIGMLQQAIVDAIENENTEKTTKEVDVSFVKNKDENQNTRQPTQDQVKQEK
jgi:hypothetical protein